MSGPTFVKPNTEQVAAKVLDGEAILINLVTGVYYSMRGSGAFVWEQLELGRSPARIAEALAQAYEVPQERAATDLEALLSQLKEEGVVLEGSPGPDATWEPSGERQAYEPPELEIFRDMGDLLAVDPPLPSLDYSWAEDEATP